MTPINPVMTPTPSQIYALSHAMQSGNITQVQLSAPIIFLIGYFVWFVLCLWLEDRFYLKYWTMIVLLIAPLIVLAVISILLIN